MSENLQENNNVQNTTGQQELQKEDVLSQLAKTAKKQLMYQRISAICLIVMALLFAYAVFTIVPQVGTTLGHINDVANSVQSSITGIDTMVEEMTTASKDLNKLVDENAETLTSAVKSLSEIDFEGLNQAIQDLQDAVGPMATFMNRFR
ncbi:MAG: hypothetical protein K6G10_10765 [Butyrivibrio sp.]|nr:hypothetical protein [Butyrivibrio sp.]